MSPAGDDEVHADDRQVEEHEEQNEVESDEQSDADRFEPEE